MVRLTMRASMASAAVRRVAIVLLTVGVIGAIDPANTLLVIAAACGCGRRSAVRGVDGRDDARVDVRRRLVLCRAVVSGLHETCDLGAAVVEAVIGALIAQTREFERAVAVLDVKAVRIEGSKSLDDPAAALEKKK